MRNPKNRLVYELLYPPTTARFIGFCIDRPLFHLQIIRKRKQKLCLLQNLLNATDLRDWKIEVLETGLTRQQAKAQKTYWQEQIPASEEQGGLCCRDGDGKYISALSLVRLQECHKGLGAVRISARKFTALWLNSELTKQDIEHKLGVGWRVIARHAKELDLPSRRVRRRSRCENYRSDVTQTVVARLWKSCSSVAELSRLLNCNWQTARNRLRDAGLYPVRQDSKTVPMPVETLNQEQDHARN